MIVAGPNARKDYHYNETEELYYQLEGDIVVRIQEDGKPVDVPIKKVKCFYCLPWCHILLCDQKVLLASYRTKRQGHENDGLLWFCENCNHKLHESYFKLENIEKISFKIQHFYGSDELRKCPVLQPRHGSRQRFVD